MEGIGSKTIIHVGAELMVAGGIVFWFRSEISRLERENAGLVSRIETLEKVVGSHHQILSRLPPPPSSSPSPKEPIPREKLDEYLQDELSAIRESRSNLKGKEKIGKDKKKPVKRNVAT